MAHEIPTWVTYPDAEWQTITPEEAGLNVEAWEKFLHDTQVKGAAWEGEQHGEGEWGTVLTRGGYIVHVWGNPDYTFQTASVGKAFTWAALGLAVDRGLIKADDLVYKTWTGEGQLSHPHKYLNEGHHKKLQWQHLVGRKDAYEHRGGFVVTNGYTWRNANPAQNQDSSANTVPAWAKWTGDPFYDNYAHAEPGTVGAYSSGGIWRLSQALTALWDKDLKAVLDDELFSKIGIPADEWEWLPGKAVRDDVDFYPHMPGYGAFVDPPYEINGHIVRGGGGWAVMNARNLARFGHLVATGGIWKGERVISPDFLRGHHGGNGCHVNGESTYYTAMSRVTTQGLNHPLPDELFAGPVKVRSAAVPENPRTAS